MLDISTDFRPANAPNQLTDEHLEGAEVVEKSLARVEKGADAVDALMAKLTQRASSLRNEARFAMQGKREQLAELASLLDDSARLLTSLSANTAAR